MNSLVSKWGAVGLGALVLVSAGGIASGKIQAWRYGQQLERQARLHADTLTEHALASAAVQRAEQNKRFQLEVRLKASDDSHYRERTHAQITQSRLRDRLATADLRLSVLLQSAPAACNSMPAAATSSRLVHERLRAELDPAHAQRIVGITHEGDRGLITLRACQAYVREVAGQR